MSKFNAFRQPDEGELWKRRLTYYTVEHGLLCGFYNSDVFDGFYGENGDAITNVCKLISDQYTPEDVCDGIDEWVFVQAEWRLKVADMAASYAELLRDRIDSIQESVEKL